MDKDSIYQVIGYHGEYNNNVKKALRKLLKENHPDHNGNIELFKLINEVKKELETNKVSFKYKDKSHKSVYSDINYDFCKEKIIKLEKELIIVNKEIEQERNKISILERDYDSLYKKSLKSEGILLNIDNKRKELKKIKNISLIMIISLIIMFITMLIKKNTYILILIILIGIILAYEIMKFFEMVNNITTNSELKIKKNIALVHDIKDNQNRKIQYEKNLLEMVTKKGKIENDLRFYSNLLKNK